MIVDVDVSAEPDYVSSKTFLEVREAYTNLLLRVIEANNIRELENKERISQLKTEIMELNAEKSAYANLESVYMDACATVENLYQNEEKLLDEYKKVNRELLQMKAKYSSLLAHSNHRINESKNEIERLKELHQSELSMLKAKNFRLESTTKVVQQALEAKEGEIVELRKSYENLMQKIRS